MLGQFFEKKFSLINERNTQLKIYKISKMTYNVSILTILNLKIIW